MRVEVTISAEGQRALNAISRTGERVRVGVARALDRQNELAIGHVVERKLSKRGELTLGVVTGRLRRSVRRSQARVVPEGAGVVIESAVGTNVRYGLYHEFGGKKVRERRWLRRGLEERGEQYRQAIREAVERALAL